MRGLPVDLWSCASRRTAFFRAGRPISARAPRQNGKGPFAWAHSPEFSASDVHDPNVASTRTQRAPDLSHGSCDKKSSAPCFCLRTSSPAGLVGAWLSFDPRSSRNARLRPPDLFETSLFAGGPPTGAARCRKARTYFPDSDVHLAKGLLTAILPAPNYIDSAQRVPDDRRALKARPRSRGRSTVSTRWPTIQLHPMFNEFTRSSRRRGAVHTPTHAA